MLANPELLRVVELPAAAPDVACETPAGEGERTDDDDGSGDGNVADRAAAAGAPPDVTSPPQPPPPAKHAPASFQRGQMYGAVAPSSLYRGSSSAPPRSAASIRPVVAPPSGISAAPPATSAAAAAPAAAAPQKQAMVVKDADELGNLKVHKRSCYKHRLLGCARRTSQRRTSTLAAAAGL